MRAGQGRIHWPIRQPVLECCARCGSFRAGRAMWAVAILVLLLLIVGAAGAFIIPNTLVVGWIALFVTALLGICGLLLISWIVRLLVRVSIGAAVSPAGDRLGKLIATTFAAVVV